MLRKLEYCGTGQYALERLTIADAADLLNELFEEQRLNQQGMDDDMYGYWN
jgi:hypothetical protein